MSHNHNNLGGHASVPGTQGRTLPAPSGDAAAKAFDPWILWVTFRRCWPWAIPLGAALAGIAAFVVIRGFVPRYQASYLLEANEDFVVFKGVMPVMENMARTEKNLFTNPIVLDPVLADPSLRTAPSLSNPETAEANLRKNLSIGSGGTDSRLVVSYTDTDREAAAQVCNAIVESYLRQRDSFDNTRVNNLERWLDPEIQRWEQEVDERRKRVQLLKQKSFGYAPGQSIGRSDSEAHATRMSELRSQVGDLKIKLALFDVMAAELPALEVGGSKVPDPAPAAAVEIQKATVSEREIENAIDGDAKVKAARAVVDRYNAVVLDLEIQDMVRISKDYYLDMKQNLEDAKDTLKQERDSARTRVTKELERIVDEDYRQRKAVAERTLEWQQEQQKRQLALTEQERKLEETKNREAQLKERERSRKEMVAELNVVQSEYDEERERLEQYGGMTAELEFAEDEQAVASDVLTKLRGRVAAIRTERRQDGAVRTLAAATPPRAPVEAVPYKKLALASAGAFVIPFLIGLLWEFKVQRLTDAETHDKTGLLAPVLGEVSRLPAGSGSQKARRVFEESIDSLRSNLFLSVDTRHIRSIAVVSSMSGEGKSSVASQLALSMAKSTGETVLLVDGDLRRPDQHEIFGIEMGPGFTGVLAGKSTLDGAVNSSLGRLIHILPAGQLSASPHRLVSPTSIKSFVDDALLTYRYVVIDTAPVLAAGESLAIASAVDATLICVMRDVSLKENVLRTTRRLQAAGASVAGTVFSGVSARQYGYRYGNYHYALPDTMAT
ncbi:polysaccharide biosynthesis tyrosine autokinase [Allorhodopirellula heiligendammensis]|uniref:Tyrosine-protein kinase YwqD n=1 Tax=Allorhodopirellula heiligendammensis TaxID=2714739 RepID=A0A5C6C5T3_9BACT|nr:polysaccharide biosynthesis tyrosine autokinase [Allorhodopirellula heiligendammensis]TWU19432.1 Tyrosine-protein kinase YwqD [Allorhodopirellula heiligendammensis]